MYIKNFFLIWIPTLIFFLQVLLISIFKIFIYDFCYIYIDRGYLVYLPLIIFLSYIIIAPLYTQIPVIIKLRKFDITRVSSSYKKFIIIDSFILCLFIYLFLVILFILNFNNNLSIDKTFFLYKSLSIDIYTLVSINVLTLFFLIFLKISRISLLSAKYSIESLFLIIFSIFFMFFAILSYDIFFLFLSLEGISMSIYLLILCTSNINSQGGVESGLKYFFLGSISSSIASLGMAILNNNLGTLNIYSIVDLCYKDNLYIYKFSTLSIIGIWFITLNFLFKLSVPPMHTWTPEVFTGASIIPVFFMSTVAKLGNFFIFLKWFFFIYWAIPDVVSRQINPLLIVFSLVGLFIGATGAMQQTKLKRFLAYTSINQLSMCVLALTTSTSFGFASAISHIFVYVLTSCIFFYALFKVSSLQNFPMYLSELSKYVYLNPFYSFIIVLTIFSFSGTPPTSLFFTKVLIMKSLIISNKIVILILLLLSSVYSSFYYVKFIKIILTRGVNTSFSVNLLNSGNIVLESKNEQPNYQQLIDSNIDFKFNFDGIISQINNNFSYYYKFINCIKILLLITKFIFEKLLVPLFLILAVLFILPIQFLTSLLYIRIVVSCWFLLTFNLNEYTDYGLFDNFIYNNELFNMINFFNIIN